MKRCRSAPVKHGGTLLVRLALWMAILIPEIYAAAKEPMAQLAVAEAPDAACRGCHQQIYDRYEQTPMARASGRAIDGLREGRFVHGASGVRYQLFRRDGKAWLSYDRQAADKTEVGLHGEQELKYFIGSGNRGRTYLFERDGFWFESPVNWYSKKQVWDMNPKSLGVREMPFTMPVDSTCLHCHSSAPQAALPGSRNHFAGLPFLHGGITCEGCHGDASAHLANPTKSPMLKLASLPEDRRTSVCLQCHLEGEIAVNESGRSLQLFKPGDDLMEDVRFFVHAGEVGANGRATSQWEALLQSACFRKSGGRMTCTTCHDPHDSLSGDTGSAERVAYYRGKCLNCHNDAAFVAGHHVETPDCMQCHMARERSQDIAHEQVTDHFIQKRPSGAKVRSVASGDVLSEVGGGTASNRDLGLAYAQLGMHGDAVAAEQGRRLLKQYEHEQQKPGLDATLHTDLGYLELAHGDGAEAAQEFREALTIDPADSVAASNLAVLLARALHLPEAISLWRIVTAEDPAETAAGVNLARAACMQQERATAISALQRVLAFSPDDGRAKGMLAQMQNNPQACGADR